ncbi:hypothetical protein CNR22_15065 [Sphingobacteriaceae bacterium]|nr:hypothetical protein CNR22_15065 [Sphingobacteriaceae bacterium]
MNLAQTDSIVYAPGKVLEDAVYLTHDDFRHYRGIRKAQMISKTEKEQLDFLSKVLFEEKMTYEENGERFTVESKKVWGYMQNGTLYVNFKGEFFRVPVFGSISYFVATVTVINPGFYDPRFGMSTGSGTTKEIREFIMNYYDGILVEFSPEEIDKLLARDPVLFAEFKKLSRRQQKEQTYGYIRKYNALHPIYFLR